jgi:hypothetical protein
VPKKYYESDDACSCKKCKNTDFGRCQNFAINMNWPPGSEHTWKSPFCMECQPGFASKITVPLIATDAKCTCSCLLIRQEGVREQQRHLVESDEQCECVCLNSMGIAERCVNRAIDMPCSPDGGGRFHSARCLECMQPDKTWLPHRALVADLGLIMGAWLEENRPDLLG